MADPVYVKIVEDIKKKVNSAELKPGDTVPPETALCKEYGVSRMTVRKSLAILANEGFIFSVPGKGSYVQKPEVNKYTLHYDEMNNPINSVDNARLLEVTIIMPDEKLADMLQITRNKHVIMIRRLFYTDGIPVAYDVKYLLYSKGMPIVEKEIEQATFQEMVANNIPTFTLKKRINISAQIPNEEIKRYLNIYDELALLVIEQKLYNNESKPIGIGVTSYRGDYIKLQGSSY